MNRRSLLRKACLRSKQRIYTVGKNYNIRSNFVAESVNTLYLAVFNNEVFYSNAINKFSTSVFCLLSKPLVEGATKNGIGFLTSLFQFTCGVINREVGVRRHKRNTLMSNLALQRCFLIIRKYLSKRMRVNTTARHVLSAGVITTLDNKNRLASGREGISSYRTSAASTHDNRVKIGHAFPFRERI